MSRTKRRVVAMGDPQAPFSKVMAVLSSHGLLDGTGRLRDDVHLVSMGDHFDWGPPAMRAMAAADSLRTLEWLCSHDASEITVLAGNHDLARVTELAHFDDEQFRAAQAEADAAYRDGAVDVEAERAFLRKYKALAAVELASRDYATFTVAQRVLVTKLLRERRMRLAACFEGMLFVHSGVTLSDLRPIDFNATFDSAEAIAVTLNAFLDARVAAWHEHEPLNLEPIHTGGDAVRGEGTGILYHRPVDPKVLAKPLGPPPRRRFDPHELPVWLTQVVGHIRDAKCRQLMPDWCDDAESKDGLRSLKVVGEVVEYRHGIQPAPNMIFIDAGMNHLPAGEYPLFDVASRTALERVS